MKHQLTREQLVAEMNHRAGLLLTEAKRLGANFNPLDGQEQRFRENFNRVAERVAVKGTDFIGWGSSNSVQFVAPGVWGSECTVDIKLIPNPERELPLKAETEINWSCTDRTPAVALATINLYQRAIEFACYVEAVMSR